MEKKHNLKVDIFDIDKLLDLFAELSNDKDDRYEDLHFCLKKEYAVKLPDKPLYFDNATAEDIATILSSENRIETIYKLPWYKRIIGGNHG